MTATLKHLFITALAIAATITAHARTADTSMPADSVSAAVGTVLGSTIGQIVNEFEQSGITLDRSFVAATAAKAIEGRDTGIDLARAQLIVNGILGTMKPIAGIDSFDTASQTRFLDEAAARPGAVRTASGVVLETIAEGKGPMPQQADSVSVFYVGRLSDGTVFDATDDPVVFPLAKLTPGLAEGIAMMQCGGKYRVTIPASQAYGEEGIQGIIPGRAALQFIVELIEIIPTDNKSSN